MTQLNPNKYHIIIKKQIKQIKIIININIVIKISVSKRLLNSSNWLYEYHGNTLGNMA